MASAAPGGWDSLPELAVDRSPRSRSIDVALVRWRSREAIVGEIWDWFDDVGGAFRALDAKKQLLRDRLDRDDHDASAWTVRGLFIVRGTSRNRLLLAELGALFAAKFPGRATDWLAALQDAAHPIPAADGLLWSDARGGLHGPRRAARRVRAER